jgi:hypothetical protein
MAIRRLPVNSKWINDSQNLLSLASSD